MSQHIPYEWVIIVTWLTPVNAMVAPGIAVENVFSDWVMSRHMHMNELSWHESLIQMQWQHPASWWRIYIIWISHVATHIMRMSRHTSCDWLIVTRLADVIAMVAPGIVVENVFFDWVMSRHTSYEWVIIVTWLTHANVMVAPGIVVMYSLTESCRDTNHMRESSWRDLLIQMRWQHPASKWRIYCMSESCRNTYHMSESSWHDSFM